MNQQVQDALFVGLTRPTTIFGITIEIMIINMIVTAIIFIATQDLCYLLLMLPTHICAMVICHDEPGIFQLIAASLRHKTSRNRHFWQASSYRAL
jgi:type IV secretion system protein VirB3